MTTITQASTVGEWGVDRLDLDAYLMRIGYTRPIVANGDTLRRLHRLHADTIAFENLDIILGRTIELDIESLQDKLVRRPRGGYCFEQNALFAAVLERIGFSVTRLAARVQPAKGGPRTHMMLRVQLDDGPWLADVGFGASLLEPLPMKRAAAQQGGWTYRLEPADHDGWLLQQHGPDGWWDLYAFTNEAQLPIDYAVYNHYTTTHPQSKFVGRIVALRTEPDVRHALRDLELMTSRPDGNSQSRRIEPGDVPGVLAERFGIELPADDAARLRRAVA